MTTRSPTDNLEDGRRAMSELVGVVLLVGLVIAGAALIILSGAAVQDEVSDQNRMQTAESSMDELDSGLTSLSEMTGEDAIRTFDLALRNGESITMENGGMLTLGIHDGNSWNSECQSSIQLDRLSYKLDDGSSVSYQAGGIWRHTDSGTTMISSPDIGFNKGMLNLRLIELRGDEAGTGGFTAEKMMGPSEHRTEEIKDELFSADECARPDKLRLSVDVKDDSFYAWLDFLRDEVPDGAMIDANTVTNRIDVVLPASVLHRQADDDRNHVVDFTSDEIAGELATTDDGVRFKVEKDTDNVYRATGTLLGSNAGYTHEAMTTEMRETYKEVPVDGKKPIYETREVPITEMREVEVNKTVEKPIEGDKPLEVVFVIDQSGSMSGGLFSDSPMNGAIDATREFVDTMPDGFGHKAGIVGYHNTCEEDTLLCLGFRAEILTPVHHGLSTDQGSLKSTLSYDNFRATGQTPIGAGMEQAIDVLENQGNSSNNQTIVLLTDGRQNDGVHPMDGPAQKASEKGINVHTVSYGNLADEEMMKKIAGETNGDYYDAEDAGELEAAFDKIVKDETYKEVEAGGTKMKEVVVGYEEKEVIVDYEEVEETELVFDGYEEVTVVDERWIVNDPLVVSYDTPTMTESQSLVAGETVVQQAANYRDGSASMPVGFNDGNWVDTTADLYACGQDDMAKTGETESPVGEDKTYYHVQCVDNAGGQDAPEEVYVFQKGDELPEIEGATEWWQEDFREIVDDHLADLNGDSNWQFDIDSNEVIVAYAYEDDEPNNAVVHYDVGDSPEDTSAEWIVDLEISVIETR